MFGAATPEEVLQVASAVASNIAPRRRLAPGAIDENVLAILRGLQRKGRPDIVQRTIRLYLDGAPRFLEILQQSVLSGDIKALRYASHTLGSSSVNLGAVTLAAWCNELETLARSGAVPAAAAMVHAIAQEYRAVSTSLTARLEGAA